MNHAPLYRQIADQLRNDILDGKYELGSLLPTEIQLEALFKVSKITIRNAVKILAEEGYVTKKSGVGTRVIRNNLLTKMEKVASFSQIVSMDKNATAKRSELEVVEIDTTHPYYEIFGQRYMKFVKHYYIGQALVACFVYAFQYFEFDENDKEVLNSLSLHQFLAVKNYDVSKVRDAFKIINRDEEDEACDMFKRETKVLLKRSRTVLNHDGFIIGFHTGYIDTSIYPYVVEFDA